MISTNTKNATQAIAELLAKRADELGIAETRVCEKAGLSKSYLSKAKKGGMREIPEDNLTKLAAVVELSPKKIFELLDLPEPLWMKPSAVRRSAEPRIRLRFPYIASVPDHLWPLLARDIFSNYGIELLDEPLSLNEFKTRMNDVEKGLADTICVVNSEWLTEKAFLERLRPVCMSHLYHGYALIGRKDWEIRSLDTSPTLSNLFALLAELRYHNVLAEKDSGERGSIAYCDKGGWEFVDRLLKVAQDDPKTKKMLTGVVLNEEVPPIFAATLTFLEPLSWVGSDRFDFVVGHALTAAKAMALDEFKVFANFRHLEQVIEMLEEKKKAAHRQAIVALQRPVVLAMNIPQKWNDNGEIEQKCLRICEVVNASIEQMFKSPSNATVRDLEEILSKREQTSVGVRHLRNAWDASYDFLTVAEALKHTARLTPANEIMEQFLSRKHSVPNASRATSERTSKQV